MRLPCWKNSSCLTRFGHGLLLVAGVVVLLHLMLHPVRVLGMSTSIFYMDERYTLASYFVSVVGVLTGMVWLCHGKARFRWLNKMVGSFFIALSLDEFFELHEYVHTIIKSQLVEESLLRDISLVSWLFPLAGAVVAVLSLLLVRFFKEQDRRARLYMGLGIASFGLVLVFELLGSLTYGMSIYVYFVAVEEGLEMVGVSLFYLAGVRQADADY